MLFYLFNRHTTRYPDREDIEKSTEALRSLAADITSSEKTRLCQEDLTALGSWIMPFVPDQDNMVAPQGVTITEQQGGFRY